MTEINSVDEMAPFRAWYSEQLGLHTPEELDAAVQAAERDIPLGLPDDPSWVRFGECVEVLKRPKEQHRAGVLRARALEIVRLRRASTWQSECSKRLLDARAWLAKVKPFHSFVESRLNTGLAADLEAAATLDQGEIARAVEAFSAACAAVTSAADEADKSARAAVAEAQAELDRAPLWLKETRLEAA